jgi:hypothetical protein
VSVILVLGALVLLTVAWIPNADHLLYAAQWVGSVVVCLVLLWIAMVRLDAEQRGVAIAAAATVACLRISYLVLPHAFGVVDWDLSYGNSITPATAAAMLIAATAGIAAQMRATAGQH